MPADMSVPEAIYRYYMVAGENILVAGENILVAGGKAMVAGENIMVAGEKAMVAGEKAVVAGENVSCSESPVTSTTRRALPDALPGAPAVAPSEPPG